MKKFVVVLLIFAVLPLIGQETTSFIDGNTWKYMTDTDKALYVKGASDQTTIIRVLLEKLGHQPSIDFFELFDKKVFLDKTPVFLTAVVDEFYRMNPDKLSTAVVTVLFSMSFK